MLFASHGPFSDSADLCLIELFDGAENKGKAPWAFILEFVCTSM